MVSPNFTCKHPGLGFPFWFPQRQLSWPLAYQKRYRLTALPLWEVAGLTSVGLACSLPLSISIDAAIDRATGRVEKLTNIDADGVACHVAFPPDFTESNASKIVTPVVVLIHQLYGLQKREVELCEELAREGYVAVAVDTFDKKSSTWLPRAISIASSKALAPGSDYGVPEVLTVVNWIRRQKWGKSAKLAVSGFCYGGGCSVRFAVQHPGDVQAVVVFYGRPVKQDEVEKIKCPLLGIYGTDDSQFTEEEINNFEEGLNKLSVTTKISRYENQPHAFVKDLKHISEGGAAQKAWEEFLAFLGDHLKVQEE